MVRLISSPGRSQFLTRTATRTLLIWILIAILSGITAISAWRWTIKAADRVTHTLLVQQELTKWLSATQDLENGQLAYLLTKDAKYLAPYESAKGAVALIHSNLIGIIRGDAGQAAMIEAIDITIREQIAAIEKTLAMFDKGGYKPGVHPSESTLAVMERLRGQIAAAKLQEKILFAARLKQFRRRSSWLLAAMLATLLACAALAFVAMIRERQRVMALELTALTLRSTNRTLEKRVEVRTEELAIERDRAEAERERAEALLRDVTHRIGNTLALVVGFINLHIRHTTDPKSLKTLTGARDRIHAIASAQRRINVVNDLELVRIDTLILGVLDDVVDATGEDRIALRIDVPPLLASAQVATSLCVLTQEFVVNSFKHAFGDDDGGSVSVRLKRRAETGAELIIEDDGRGLGCAGRDMSGDEQADGLGTKIAALLTRQFAGTISYEALTPNAERPGTRVTVTLTDLILSEPDHAITQHEQDAPSPLA